MKTAGKSVGTGSWLMEKMAAVLILRRDQWPTILDQLENVEHTRVYFANSFFQYK